MKIAFELMQSTFKNVLIKTGFSEEKAILCANIFAENSRDGIYSHGLNRFPVFVNSVKEKQVDIFAEPVCHIQQGVIEYWEGNLAPGMYVATLAMQKAISIAKQNGLGCVAVRNSNHWMRGGTYGWQAANEGCIGICSSNTIANMPAWGGIDPRLGNNPLVIAVPRKQGHVVLDMAMSQFSYGKMQEYQTNGTALPVAGGYDRKGRLSTSPSEIRSTHRTLPIGFWKGSGLSLLLDILLSSLSGGRSVSMITADGKEKGLSQLFLCIYAASLDSAVIEEIIKYTSDSKRVDPDAPVYYPGEKTMNTRMRNDKEGIPVNDDIWKEVLALNA